VPLREAGMNPLARERIDGTQYMVV